MPLMTGDEYVRSLQKIKMRIFLFGEEIDNPVGNPILQPAVNSVKATYDLAQNPEYADLMTATSNLTGEKINRFTHIHQSPDDLVKKVKMQRLLGQKTAACFQRCVGMDSFNSVYSTTYEVDKKYGTHYHDNFVKFATYVQQNDLTVDGAMTDTKGDRSLSPSKQADPDLFLHVVERRPDGIVVRGAKAHQTGILNSHEVIVMPTIAMGPDDKDYAVSFAVPLDTEGLMMIVGRQSCDTRKTEGCQLDLGNSTYGGMEALTVFDNVFVPNDRIFLNGETEFAGMLVERFAGYHRQSYGGCKVGVGDVLIGAGNYLIDLMLANVCKQNVTRFPYEIARLAQDIAGGLMVTLPSEKDMAHPVVGPVIRKYLAGPAKVDVMDRFKIMRLIENLTLGTAAVGYLTESMHGAGSPQAQRIMISRQSNMSAKKAMAKHIAHIKD